MYSFICFHGRQDGATYFVVGTCVPQLRTLVGPTVYASLRAEVVNIDVLESRQQSMASVQEAKE